MLQPPPIFRLSIHATVPPPTDPRIVLQRTDEVNSVLRMLSDAQISTVVLTGDPGAGKSILAALLYQRLGAAAQAGQTPIRHFAWLTLGPNATLPDVIAAVVGSVDMISSDFFMRKPEEQISMLEQALCRPHESAFVVLDQFEELLDIESSPGLAGRGAVALFLDLLQRDLGDSRVVITCRHSPYNAQNGENMRVRTNLVSRISLPEGVALLQQRGVQGTPEELSLIWQRCAGHVFGLVQFATLCTLSGFSLSYLLNSPDYVPVWNGEVTLNLIDRVYSFLNPIQRTLLRSLCLYNEPVPVEGVIIAITGEEDAVDLDVTAFERELGALTWFALVQHYPEDNSTSSYFLHSLLRQYMIEYYLEGSDRYASGGMSIALGVTTEPDPMLVNQEAREVALAAGHIRVAVYYAGLAQQNCPPPQNRSGPQDVEPLLAMAYHLCLGWHWQQAYDLLCYEGLNESMMQWGAWNTLIQLYTAMVPPRGIVTRRDEGQIFSQLGLLYGRLGDYQQSHFYYEQALATQREIGDQHGEAVTLANQGELLRSVGEIQQARANFEQASMLNRQEYDAQLEIVLLHNLGLLSQDEKDYQQALHCYQQSLKLAQNQQERSNTGMILTNIGMLLYEQNRLQEALALLFSALEIRQAAHDRTVASLVRFLEALEQKIGRDAFIHLRREALGRREEVMARVRG